MPPNERKPVANRVYDWILIGLSISIVVALFLLMLIPCIVGIGE